MGDIFHLDTTSFLIIHCGAFVAGVAIMILLWQAYVGIKNEKEISRVIKNELNYLKYELRKTKNTKLEVEEALYDFEEENTKIRDLRKEIENYRQILETELEKRKKERNYDEN